MPNTINQDVVRYVDTTGKVFKQAEALVNQLAVEEAKVAEVAPKVATLLANQGLIRKGEHELATKKLASHEGALEVVQNLLGELGSQKRAYEQKIAAAGNGSPVDPRTVSQPQVSLGTVDVMRGGVLGQRVGLGQKKAADYAFEQVLMGMN